jgi:hypothetical protein
MTQVTRELKRALFTPEVGTDKHLKRGSLGTDKHLKVGIEAPPTYRPFCALARPCLVAFSTFL